MISRFDSAQTSFPTTDLADITNASTIRRVALDLVEQGRKCDALDWLARHAGREDLGPQARETAREMHKEMKR